MRLRPSAAATLPVSLPGALLQPGAHQLQVAAARDGARPPGGQVRRRHLAIDDPTNSRPGERRGQDGQDGLGGIVLEVEH